ncbi:MAG: 6-phosphofructokinase [Firmicutes bacterium]|nr:6-phosphofructokinase [Bacillota bacterium]
MAKELRGACIVGQSGGPTSVINASLQGVVQAALNADCITNVYGAAHGIKGILDDILYDFGKEDPEQIELLQYTPSAALGSCRYKLADPDVDDTDYKRILEIFKKYDIRYFFYNGGNDSMDTCSKVSRFMQKNGYECRIIGVPKTIDNDLVGTDHCPGFPSAAKFVATTAMEVLRDSKVYDTGMVVIMEIMGRDTGWLTGSAALSTLNGDGPDLIYMPETDFYMDRFLQEVSNVDKEKGECFVAVSEGIHYPDGTLVADTAAAGTDSFGHAQLGGLAPLLADECKKQLGIKVRPIELSLLQRCASHLASARDVGEARRAGFFAVESAIAGETDKMVGFECKRDFGYYCEFKLYDLEFVANKVKTVPREWINEAGNGVTEEFIHYVLPLIQGRPEYPLSNGLPQFSHFKRVIAK